jgi:tetratricopeptide (TPR) repeat protein
MNLEKCPGGILLMSARNILHVTDLGDGHVQVSWQQGNSVPRHFAGQLSFSDPLTIADRAELRWYLEEFLEFPYGAEPNRARQLEDRMAAWGESLFKQVFVKGEPDPDPRAFYQEAVREGLHLCELCISSDKDDFLNIPWELMRDPTAGRGFLAPLLAGLYRQRATHKIEAVAESPAEEPFRVLLVIARPYGDTDVPLGTVARPVLEALRPLWPHIELEMLRPPTFDELQKRLNANRGHYGLVHFDGHGVFAASTSGLIGRFGVKADTGHLVFEKEDGSPDIVNSTDLGQALATCKVPLFVLNACQSAEEGKGDPFSSVASQLIAIGASGVVAMSYSVYASTAAMFMQRFYEKLVGHAPLSEAVAEARRRLFAEPDRNSVAGLIELRDWIVPSLYQQQLRFVPIPRLAVQSVSEEPEADQVRERLEEICPEGRFGFIGRDYEILRIERALRGANSPWALVQGIGGTGKTELAYGFARWFAETGGCPGGAFVASFKEKANFAQVIGSIVGFGTDFSRLPEDEQWKQLTGFLRANACLLIWDNFEPVAGYPRGAQPLASDEERQKLSRFLKTLKGGKSRVLITTRKKDEDWLGIGYELVEIGGLVYRDAALLAKEVLRSIGKTSDDFKQDADYARLIKLLRGHPRSIEVVLRQLRDKTPLQIIEALQERVSRLGEEITDSSLGYAFSQMSDRTRKHLPVVGLLAAYADADTLGNFVKVAESKEQNYTRMLGEGLDADGWEEVLEEAARNGLLRSVGHRVYELHPTLPTYLRRELIAGTGEDGLRRLDSELMKFYAGFADALLDGARQADRNTLARVSIEEANLLRSLRGAEREQEWENAQAIAQTLGEFYKARGRTEEWAALRTGLLGKIGRETKPGGDRDRADLWMYLLGNEANDVLERNDLDTAERTHKQILDYLVSLNDSSFDFQVAVVYHQLGMIAQERQQFDQAEQWYRKALEIRERLGLEKDAASDYHELGIVAQEWQQFVQAEQWYRKALEIRERLGLEGDAATDYHQLGMIAREKQQFVQAEQWYRKALEVFERLGLEREAAIGYHELGIVAQKWQQFVQAEQWYRKALEVFEQMGHPPLAVNTLAQLGFLNRKLNRYREAVSWYGQALIIALNFQMRIATQILTHLALLIKEMGEEAFIASWKDAFDGQDPPLDLIKEIQRRLESDEQQP